MAIFDTKAIRESARKVKSVENGMDQPVSLVNSAMGKVDAQLQGLTAEALYGELKSFKAELSAVKTLMGAVNGELISYAERLEALDRAMAALIGKN